jgi:hypothetical protein
VHPPEILGGGLVAVSPEMAAFPAADATEALYAKPAKPAMGAEFHQVLIFERGDVVQLVRTLPCHGRGRGFESRRPRHSFEWFTQTDQKQSGSFWVQ